MEPSLIVKLTAHMFLLHHSTREQRILVDRKNGE